MKVNSDSVGEIVDVGIDEIFKNVIDNFGIESGDISPMQKVELDRIRDQLVEMVENWITSRLRGE